MYYKCNWLTQIQWNVSLNSFLRYVLSRRSQTFFLFRLWTHPDKSPPPPPFISPPKTSFEVIQAQGFKVGFYGIALSQWAWQNVLTLSKLDSVPCFKIAFANPLNPIRFSFKFSSSFASFALGSFPESVSVKVGRRNGVLTTLGLRGSSSCWRRGRKVGTTLDRRRDDRLMDGRRGPSREARRGPSRETRRLVWPLSSFIIFDYGWNDEETSLVPIHHLGKAKPCWHHMEKPCGW